MRAEVLEKKTKIIIQKIYTEYNHHKKINKHRRTEGQAKIRE